MRTIQEGVRAVGDGFTKPDDDWAPMLFAESENGELAVVEVGAFFESGAAKEVFGTRVLPGVVRQFNARRVGIVSSAWMAYVASAEATAADLGEGFVRPSKRSDREEVVMVAVIDADGARAECARIGRARWRAPTLGDFVPYDDVASGLFVDEARRAFAERDE